VRRVRRDARNLGVALRRLERTRDDERDLPKASAGEEGDLHAFLLGVLEHALLQVEEGWAELAGCFSKEGLVFARRQAKKRKG
jgi:hypothetical protein